MSVLFDACVHVRRCDGVAQAAGERRFFRGHQIARAGGQPPDGIFAAWEWDGRRLVVRNDRYGAAPLFCWRDAEQLAVSPSILALLEMGAPTALDEAGVAVFLRLGFFLGDDTPFAAIRAVPPGAVLEWIDGALTVSAGRPRIPPNAIGRRAAIDGFIDLLRQAVRRRPPAEDDRTFVPVSSGRDSRHILFNLSALGHRPRCVTIERYPPRAPEDERIGPLVARAAGAPHTTLRQGRSRLDAEVRKNWTTGLCADEHAWYVAMIDALGTRPAVLYHGLGGALCSTNRFASRDAVALMASGRTREVAERLLADFSLYTEPLLVRALHPGIRAALSHARAVDRLAAELATHLDEPEPLMSFNFWTRERRELALVPFGMMRHIPVVYTPTLDHDLFDFLMGLPATVMSPDLRPGDKTFHTDAINRAFPQHTSVPYEDKRAAKIDARAHYRRFAAETGPFVIRHSAGRTALLNRLHALPRAVLASAGGLYGGNHPWFASLSLYLTQLQMVASGFMGAWDRPLAADAVMFDGAFADQQSRLADARVLPG